MLRLDRRINANYIPHEVCQVVLPFLNKCSESLEKAILDIQIENFVDVNAFVNEYSSLSTQLATIKQLINILNNNKEN